MVIEEPKQKLADEDAPECSYCSVRPPCLQRFARPAIFVVVVSMFLFADSFIVGVIQGTITTIEHRYQFSLGQIGLLLSGFSVGGVFGNVLVILFFSKPDTNRPRLLGICSLLSGLATVVGTIPQFIQDPYVPAGLEATNDTEGAFQQVEMLCMADKSGADCTDQPAETVSPNQVAFYILLSSTLLEGASIMIMFTTVYAYISDNTTPKDTAFYTGIWGAVEGLSPVAGIFATAAFLGLWVDFYRIPSSAVPVTPEDRVWVGAWWLGYLVASVLYVLPVLPFFGFPVVMRKSRTNAKGSDSVSGDDGDTDNKSGTRFPKGETSSGSLSTLWKVLKNRDCMLTCLSQAGAILLVYGYGVFVPKYLEIQFEVETRLADILTGCLLAPAYAVGFMVAGSLVKRFNIQYRGLVSLSCVALALGVAGLTANLFIGCPNENVAGVFTPYKGQSQLDLEAPCNSACECSLSAYSPVCDGHGITYISACHAGCQLVTEQNQEYGDCSCLATGPTNLNGTLLTVEGACDSHCISYAPYLVLLTAVLLFAQFAQLMRFNIVMRCVSSAERPVALAILYLAGLLGTIPASYMFGALIDTACVGWQQTCYGQGACFLYDKVWYRYTFNGSALGVAIICLGSMLIVWKFPSYTDKDANDDVKGKENKASTHNQQITNFAYFGKT
ncbi:solute carrier organic anion transporter family member 3A1-like [Patiria miniata]|uniref:Solute carrier organic anion transporter family member n=1 Tax=Patiria miniata TaxID=46514 RepID=A0A914B7W0_PATMI|nr:solute carrier organic anion transporter family member 3A1-like [Patiria miniata]